MIVWKSEEKPWFLQGAVNLQHAGNLWWVSVPGIFPDAGLNWLTTKAGYDVALCGEPNMLDLQRESTWQMVSMVIDARGREWVIPQILEPNGIPIVPQIRLLNEDGQWTSQPADDRQKRAIEACLAYRQRRDSADEQETTAWILALLECVYHIDGISLGRLGLVDDCLCNLGLRVASAIQLPEALADA